MDFHELTHTHTISANNVSKSELQVLVFITFENLALQNLSIFLQSVHSFSCKIFNPHFVQISMNLLFSFTYLSISTYGLFGG